MEKDLCSNCDNWREVHYYPGGAWRGEIIGCPEYSGIVPPPGRRAKKEAEIAKHLEEYLPRHATK